MARPGWYNDNRNRAFPFLRGTVGEPAPESGSIVMGQLFDDTIVDLGFLMGPDSGFVAGTHTVSLDVIRREGEFLIFEFACDAPALQGSPLMFLRSMDDPLYLIEYLDNEEEIHDSLSATFCPEPLWSGYMVSGDLETLAARLGDGEVISGETGKAVVEPALIQNLAGSYIASIALANADRTRVTSPEGCSEPVWPYPLQDIWIGERCLQGDIRWKGGYNTIITQNPYRNQITIRAEVGAGEGNPCDQVKLFPEETPPHGSQLLEGGPRCTETVRSINGLGGTHFNFLAGRGVEITAVPEDHTVVIDISMLGLTTCYTEQVSEVSESI